MTMEMTEDRQLAVNEIGLGCFLAGEKVWKDFFTPLCTENVLY